MASYVADPDKKKAAVRALYVADPDKKKVASIYRALYMLNPLKKNIADRAAYRDNADRRRAAAKACYDANPRLKCEASKAAYKTNPDETKALFRDYHASHRSARLRYFRKYHSYTKLKRVTRYSLAQPNQLSIEKYFRNLQVNILADREVLLKLKEEFKSLHAGVADTLSRAELEKTVGRLSVKRLVCKALQIRRKHAGFLVATIKLIKSISLKERNDFGKGYHTSSTEPFFYEAAYLHVRDPPIPVNEKGECVVAQEVPMGAGSKNEEGKDAASKSNLSQEKVSDKGPAQSDVGVLKLLQTTK